MAVRGRCGCDLLIQNPGNVINPSKDWGGETQEPVDIANKLWPCLGQGSIVFITLLLETWILLKIWRTLNYKPPVIVYGSWRILNTVHKWDNMTDSNMWHWKLKMNYLLQLRTNFPWAINAVNIYLLGICILQSYHASAGQIHTNVHQTVTQT